MLTIKYTHKDNENKSLIVILNYHIMLHNYYKLIRAAEMGVSVCRNSCSRITIKKCCVCLIWIKKTTNPFQIMKRVCCNYFRNAL